MCFRNITLMISKIISIIIILFLASIILATPAAASQTSVNVNSPEKVDGDFIVTIEIEDVANLDSGQFDLSFDPDVVSFVDVEPGSIDGTEVPIDMFRLMEDGRVRVLFNIDDVESPNGVSGSGYLAMIRFEGVGGDGDTSALELSEGLLSCYESVDRPGSAGNPIEQETDADWSGDVVTVGGAGTVETEKIASTPVQTATPRPPPSSLDTGAEPVTTSTPATEHASDAAVTVGASERDEPDWWEVLAEHNFIGTYLFVGLLAFTYTLILLR